MKHLLFLPLFGVIDLIRAEPLTGVDVKKTRISDYNYVVGLARIDPTKSREDNLYCSGVLLTPRHVLTNDRCIKGRKRNDIIVYAGPSDVYLTSEAKPCHWSTYLDWEQRPTNEEPLNFGINDIAIITLCNPAALYKFHPPTMSRETFEKHKQINALMIGYGNTLNRDHARFRTKASVHLIEPEICGKMTKWRSIQTGRLICTASKPYSIASKGDGGAPLLDRSRYLMGINSGVFYLHEGDPDTAVNIHVNVTYYKKFIQTIVGDELPDSWF
ncbi:hypothetical protein QAD02_019333 [Eretmocerus hayati]|uniref:Uncharacterized protein n=1 Tax=Eretmocerus hayati TaxID=131215 RepID=A0ACC2PJA5_9HYME|nr:hypothetical protein QAD02_019333 [Eretmocerus hayati]